MYRDYLVRLQALQLFAFDNGVNMQIQNRGGDNGPWIFIVLNNEGVSNYKDFCIHTFWEFYSDEENIRDFENEMTKIEETIKTLIK